MMSKIRHVGDYHPKTFLGMPNPLHDDFSKMLLGMKEGRPEYVRYFADLIEPDIPAGAVVCTVPSSNPYKRVHGIDLVASRLAHSKNRIDGTRVLQRTQNIAWMRRNERTLSDHLRSLSLREKEVICGRTVVLLDDVTTTGTSLRAASLRLAEGDPSEIQLLAIARTVRYSALPKAARPRVWVPADL